MSWLDLLDRLATLPDAVALADRLRLDLLGQVPTTLDPRVCAALGDHLDATIQDATAPRVARALATPLSRPGMTELEALQELLEAELVGAAPARRDPCYERHRVTVADAWGSVGEAVRYISLADFLTYVARVDRTLRPPPGPHADAALRWLIETEVARIAAHPGSRRARLAGADLLWVTSDAAEPAPHHAARDAGLDDTAAAVAVARRMALPGYESGPERRRRIGLCAFRFALPGPLQRPTMTEALSPGGRWFFPAPKAGPVAGRTRALASTLDRWAEPYEPGVVEWLHDNVELPLGTAPGSCRLEWWGCFPEFLV